MKLLFVLLAGTLFLSNRMYAQTENFDIATFTVPQGWQRTDSTGIVSFHDARTDNGLTSFCQINLHVSRKSSGNATKDFTTSWNELIVKPTNIKTKPKTQTEKTDDGWTVVSGSVNITTQGITFTCMLITTTGFNKTMSILVQVAGNQYTSIIQSFLQTLSLNAKATPSTPKNVTPPANTPVSNIDQYSFTAPENWTLQKGNGFVTYRQPLSATGQGCVLTILSPETSSGNLETDVKSIFSQMYPGWSFHHSDSRQYTLAKGYTKQGLAYYMMEADMMRQRGEQWDYETGAAWVIAIGKQIAILSLRHEPIGLYCECKKRYNYIGRLLNTFTIKNTTPSANTITGTSKRIIGSWMISGGGTMGEYIFAANGHYQYIGGYGSTTRVSNDMIEIKSSIFQGDGTYTINGDKLTIKRKGSSTPEILRFRFEQYSQGTTDWKDRIYLLAEKPADGGYSYEACYEKSQH
jgi:hypothetical protein